MKRQLIIIGGGYSVKRGIKKGLWDKLQGKWTVGLNYNFLFYDSYVTFFMDNYFYNQYKPILKKLDLVIGKSEKSINPAKNTILLRTVHRYYRDVNLGVFKENLIGIFALSVNIHVLDEGEIYLLGYDYGNINNGKLDGTLKTHWYQDLLQHKGTGKTNYYRDKVFRKKNWNVYANEEKVKIYNVSPNSNIDQFPKITYEEFFNRLNKKKETRQNIIQLYKDKLK